MQTRRGPFYYNGEDKICKKSSAKIYISKIKGREGLCSLCTASWSTSALRGISTAICCTQLHIFVLFCQSFIQSQVQRNARFWNSHRALWFCESPLHLNICCFPGILRFSTKFRGVFAASLQTHSIYALPDLQWIFLKVLELKFEVSFVHFQLGSLLRICMFWQM